jgi:protein TonB
VKKHRYKVSFSLTTFLYVALFSLYFYLLNQHITISEVPRDTTIELALSQFVPEAPPSQADAPVQPEQLVEEEPEPEPEKEEKAEEAEEPEEPVAEEVEEPKPEPEPEPIIKEKPVIEPMVKKEVQKPKKKVQKKKPHKKKVARKRKPRKKHQVSGGGSPRYSAGQRNRFLARIRARIDRAKSYPRIAQRRGMQGVIRVRFTILANGRVGNISLSGPKVFHASARKAVKSAFPVNVKKAPLHLPTTVNLSLRYTLH